MAASTTKKVLIRRFERETLAGYVNPISFQQPEGVELLTVEGKVLPIAYDEIHSVCFVRDFASAAEAERRTFNTRPKMEGLWVSLKFRDGEILEGIIPNNLLHLETYGITVIPPDPYSNTQRIFVPKISLAAVEVLGVVGSPLKRRKPKPVPADQIGLFEQ